MNAASILRSKTVAIATAGFLGAGLLSGVAFAATPATSDVVAMAAPDTGSTRAAEEKGKAKLKAALDALVTKKVITQAQEDAIIAALSQHDQKDHPKLREFVGDVMQGSVAYLGLPADQVKKDLASGKSLAEIANATPGKSRDGLIDALNARAADRIKDAVASGKLTQAQADELAPKVKEAIAKIVDHRRDPKAVTGTTTIKPAKPAATPKPTN